MSNTSYSNEWCRCFSSVIGQEVALRPPKVVSTPYGGRLTWILPGGTPLVTHLKDKSKIRHLKRWSQVAHLKRLVDKVPKSHNTRFEVINVEHLKNSYKSRLLHDRVLHCLFLLRTLHYKLKKHYIITFQTQSW